MTGFCHVPTGCHQVTNYQHVRATSPLVLVSLLLEASIKDKSLIKDKCRFVRLIAVEMAFEETPAIPRYRRTKNLTGIAIVN
jgi:hypothetical protein